jgi:chaperonin GroES
MLTFKTWRPTLNRVVIKKADALTKTKGGIILSTNKDDKLNFGTVIAVGPGKFLEGGKTRACLVQVGDTVLLPEYGGSKVQLGSEDNELFVYRDENIMGTLHDTSK